MSETLLFLLLLLACAEMLEAYLQYERTLSGVIARLYGYYQKSIFLFFASQTGFYVLLFIALYSGVLNVTMVFLIALKIFDIFYKLELIKKLYIQKNVPSELMAMLSQPIPRWFFLFGLFTYPFLAYYALQ